MKPSTAIHHKRGMNRQGQPYPADGKHPVPDLSVLAKALKKGLALHQAGRLDEAKEIYEDILKVRPGHADVLHLLGVLFHQKGQNDRALDSIRMAIVGNPRFPTYHFNLGVVLQAQGKLGKAISSFEKALALNPEYVEAYNNRGNCLKDLGRIDEAISSYEQALELQPAYFEACNNLGNALQDHGKTGEAIAWYEKALKIRPESSEAYNNLGNAFREHGKVAEAVACFEKALKLTPDMAEAHCNLGNAMQDLGRFQESLSSYQRAVTFKPAFAEAFSNMANVWLCLGETEKAIQYCEKAILLGPDSVNAYHNMGNAYEVQGNAEKAIHCYKKAIGIKPEFAKAYSHLYHQLRHICDWRRLGNMESKLDSLTRQALENGQVPAEVPFTSLSRSDNLAQNLHIAKAWSRDVAKVMDDLKLAFTFGEERRANDKITLGYLSNNFQNHAVAHQMVALFGLHNRQEFKVFCYSYGKDDGSYFRDKIRHDADRFVEIGSLSLAETARLLFRDQVDIIVDLVGHTQGHRMGVCALRPAPVQVSYLGFLGTTGADFIDYLITDRVVTPEEHAGFYSEHLVYLPHCYQINNNAQPIADMKWTRTDVGLPENAFVFCCFNHPYKIEPVMFDVWMRILARVPSSVLWLSRESMLAETNLKREAEARGIEAGRLVFSNKLSLEKHLARLQFADLALDTRVYNGGATTSNALWAGVPLVTLQGKHFVSRMSASSLTAVGLTELVTHGLIDYEDLAVDLAVSPDKLGTIRQKLAMQRFSEPLFDARRFTRNLELGYKTMWKVFVEGAEPKAIQVIEDEQHAS